MQTLSVLAPPMLTLCPAAGEGWGAGWGAGWAGGPRAMRDLLELALPGIDANDPEKMGSTLRFVEQCLYAVPIVGREWRGGKADTGVDAERRRAVMTSTEPDTVMKQLRAALVEGTPAHAMRKAA